MRVLKRDYNRDGTGTVGLIADSAEDFWCIYNLLEVGDKLSATTVRKVTRDAAGTGGGGDRVKTTLTIEVTKSTFDAEYASLRVAGRIAAESRLARLGAYHTIDIELHSPIFIEKAEWDAVHKKRIKDSESAAAVGADIAAIVMDVGLANVCIVSDNMTIIKARVEISVPKKRPGATGHEKALQRFHEAVIAASLRAVDFSTIKVVVVASPGFVKDEFYTYMMAEAAKREALRPLLDNKNRFVLAHAATGHKRALSGVFMDPTVMSRLSETRAAAEVECLQTFFKALSQASSKAYYGYRHVRLATDRGAVDTLLISDALFRIHLIQARHAYVQLIEDVTKAGGSVRVFSSLHVTGEQLTQMSGVAALLRFPVDDIEEASAVYAKDAAAFNAAAGAGGGVAGDEDSARTVNDFDVEYDSDGSSDSDASYHAVKSGAGVS